MPDLALEREFGAPLRRIAGVDEVGRGPLAGPVCAAAVILPAWILREGPPPALHGVDDSKALGAEKRALLLPAILELAEVGIGWASVAEIAQLNIYHASHLAMRRALAALPACADGVLVDGKALPRDLPCEGRAVVGGDARSLSIAAASIVAKESRDREMERLAADHPVYGWARNKGYATAEHRRALAAHGPCAHHRSGFAPVAALLAEAAA